MRVEAGFDRKKIWQQGKSVRYLVVRVSDPGDAPQGGRAALNLALVVDASGSMEGEPLRFAIDAAQRVVSRLSDDDRLSVVSFNARALDHLTSERMTPDGRERALRALGTISAEGCTNLSAGWLRGAEHLALTGHASQNRVVVLSDGHANEGIVDPTVLGEHAKQLALRPRRLFSSTVGIGDNYHGETLEAIAVHGGGVHHRAARPNEIVEVVTAELDDIRHTAAESIKITIQHLPGVRIKSLNEFPLDPDREESVCNLGSLVAGASRTAIFSIKFPAGQVGSQCPFEVRATWMRPVDPEVYGAEPLRVVALFADGKENRAQTPDPTLTEEVAQVWQAYIVRRIVRLNREGRYAEAIRRLDRDLPLFAKYARNAASGQVLVAELKRLRDAASREWSEGSRKEVEVAMHKRASSRVDARIAAPQAWSDFLPD
jgi:Ca-activated chloride channel family protein